MIFLDIMLKNKQKRQRSTRDFDTEWSKSAREKQVLNNIAYMWNLEIWYRLTYLQSRNRDTDVEKKCMNTKEGSGERWDKSGDWDWQIYTIDAMHKPGK